MKESKEQQPTMLEIDFSTFVVSIGSAVLMGLGLAKNPVTGNFEKNIEAAKQNIEILTMFKEKTKGNLSDEETQLLDALLYDTRMRFVEVSEGKTESKSEGDK